MEFLLMLTFLTLLPRPHAINDAERLYVRLFRLRRVEQLDAVKGLRRFSGEDQEKVARMINLMAEKIFSVLQEGRAVLESSYYIPGVSDFPTDERTRDSLSNVLENTALFSEILLRYPDATSLVLKGNKNWEVALHWGISFANQIRYLLDNGTTALLDLVGQELGLVPRDARYVNPYRLEGPSRTESEDEGGGAPAGAETRSRKRNAKRKKGPKLGGHFEL